MKETGLMFKAPLVCAILSEQKTQTRRLVKPRPEEGKEFCGIATHSSWKESIGKGHWAFRDGPLHSDSELIRPPVLQGDRIYVRETFAPFERNCFYRADGDNPDFRPWKPAIHMPKSLARIWLEVTGVRAERLQSISRGDAMAEGCPFPNMADEADPRKWFEEVWISTGGDWAANPWVWVIDFKRIAKE